MVAGYPTDTVADPGGHAHGRHVQSQHLNISSQLFVFLFIFLFLFLFFLFLFLFFLFFICINVIIISPLFQFDTFGKMLGFTLVKRCNT